MAIPFYSNTKAQTDTVLKACLLGLQQIEYKQLKHGFQFNVNCHWHVTLHHFTVLCLLKSAILHGRVISNLSGSGF